MSANSVVLRYLPIVLGIVVIVGLTIPQIVMSDRLSGGNVSAEQRAELLKKIPKKVGSDWVGEDKEVSAEVRDTAGAVGAVSREYRNIRTGEKVDLWLIVGHGREVSAHTPDICYRGSGFEVVAAENSQYMMSFPDQPQAPFLTNTFFKEDVSGRQLLRVFWSWYNPGSEENKGEVVWEAPTNSRWYFGNTRALYKMYFTSQMRDRGETADSSTCLRFAREFMPVVNEALKEFHSGTAASGATTSAAAPAVNTDSEATKTPAKSPAADASAPETTSDLFETDADSAADAKPSEPPAKPAS